MSSHPAVRRSKASPHTPVQQGGAKRRRPSAPERVSDIALAGAIAQAVRAVRGVADLSPGLGAPAATYGPGQRVSGIVVRHLAPAPDRLALGVHVVLSESSCEPAAADSGGSPAPYRPEGPGAMTTIADRIREAVRATVRSMALPAPVAVDVFVDDLR